MQAHQGECNVQRAACFTISEIPRSFETHYFKQLCGFLNITTQLPHINKNYTHEYPEIDPLQKQKIDKLFHNSNKFTGYGSKIQH